MFFVHSSRLLHGFLVFLFFKSVVRTCLDAAVQAQALINVVSFIFVVDGYSCLNRFVVVHMRSRSRYIV